MAYKKYIKRNGKIYGPYIYHSKRVDGKVVSEYRGQKDHVKLKKILVVSSLILILAALIYLMFSNISLTGNAIIDNQDPYLIKDDLTNNLQLVLNKGELIPENSKIIVKTPQKYYGYDLKDLIENETSQGNYYLKESKIKGNGSGFGIIGKTISQTEIFFKIELIESNSSNESQIIQADIQIDKPFKLKLKENQTFKIIEDSIQTQEVQLDIKDLKITQEENEVVISTTYSNDKEGFGKDFLSQEEIIYHIPLEKILEEDTKNFEIILSYDEETISSFKVEEKTLNEIKNETAPSNNESENSNKNNSSNNSSVNNSQTTPAQKNPSNNSNEKNQNKPEENSSLNNNSQKDYINNNTQIENSTNITSQEKTNISTENKNNITQEEIANFFTQNLTMKKRNYRNKVIVTYSIDEYEMQSSYESSLSQEEFEEKVRKDSQNFLIEIIAQSKNSNPHQETSTELIL